MSSNWGLCRACRWWQIEPSARIDDRTVGTCTEEQQGPLQLSVMGHCGCSLFVEGPPARVEGAADQPPHPSDPPDSNPASTDRQPANIP